MNNSILFPIGFLIFLLSMQSCSSEVDAGPVTQETLNESFDSYVWIGVDEDTLSRYVDVDLSIQKVRFHDDQQEYVIFDPQPQHLLYKWRVSSAGQLNQYEKREFIDGAIYGDFYSPQSNSHPDMSGRARQLLDSALVADR